VTFHAGDLASAVDYHRQRMDLFARASGPDASITQHATSNLAIVLAYQGNLQEARRLADQAFQKTRNVVPYLRMTPLYVSALARNMQGQPKEAEPFARDALEICEKSYAKTTSVYADYLAELGISQLLQGRAKEALPGLETADQIWSKLRRVNDPAVERVHKYYLLAKTAP
jgi:tetratricopeptide (TPR) repeat protein